MKTLPRAKLSLYAGMIVSFVMLESPLILLANRIEPLIMGVPFLLAWNLFWWFVLTALFLAAYFTHWGSKPTPVSSLHQKVSAEETP